MLRESGAGVNLSDTGHHLLTLQPAISIPSRPATETGCTGSATSPATRTAPQIRAGSGPRDGQPAQPGHHYRAPGREPASLLPCAATPPARPAAANDHELLTKDLGSGLSQGTAGQAPSVYSQVRHPRRRRPRRVLHPGPRLRRRWVGRARAPWSAGTRPRSRTAAPAAAGAPARLPATAAAHPTPPVPRQPRHRHAQREQHPATRQPQHQAPRSQPTSAAAAAQAQKPAVVGESGRLRGRLRAGARQPCR